MLERVAGVLEEVFVGRKNVLISIKHSFNKKMLVKHHLTCRLRVLICSCGLTLERGGRSGFARAREAPRITGGGKEEGKRKIFFYPCLYRQEDFFKACTSRTGQRKQKDCTGCRRMTFPTPFFSRFYKLRCSGEPIVPRVRVTLVRWNRKRRD